MPTPGYQGECEELAVLGLWIQRHNPRAFDVYAAKRNLAELAVQLHGIVAKSNGRVSQHFSNALEESHRLLIRLDRSLQVGNALQLMPKRSVFAPERLIVDGFTQVLVAQSLNRPLQPGALL